jgi:uncharacterized protein GlcG (DUF336 family)
MRYECFRSLHPALTSLRKSSRDRRRQSGAAEIAKTIALLLSCLLWVPALHAKTAEISAEAASFNSLMHIALVALQECQQQGYRVSVAIVDDTGNLKFFLRSDGAPPHTIESAQRKAFTSASFGVSSAALTEAAKRSVDIAGLSALGRVLLVSGGLPIQQGGKLIGGIGVAGGTGPGEDEACAHKGLSSSALSQ